MKRYCIPPQIASNLKQSFVDGKIKIEELYNLTSEKRREVFEKIVGKDLAKDVNADFEKAMLSPQKEALTNWLKKNTSFKKEIRDTLLEKINKLDDMGVINPKESEDFLNDFVSSSLGISVSREEAKKIVEISSKLQTTFDDLTKKSDLNNLIAYFSEREKMDKYIQEINPSSNTKILTSLISRGHMLLSPKAAITNIVGNIAQGTGSVTLRRLSSKMSKGLNNDLVIKYAKEAPEIFKKTGYDITRMMDLSVSTRILGEDITHSQGKGFIRQYGRWVEDVAFKKMQGIPDVMFSSFHRADSVNLLTSEYVQKELKLTGNKAKLKAREIMEDALSISPQTPEGKFISEKSIQDAMVATFQNDSRYSEYSMKFREALNSASGDLRLGDQNIPFVKTVANVIGTGINYAGGGAINSIYKLSKGIVEGNLNDPVLIKEITDGLVTSGLGISSAYLISTLFKPEDYIGAYPTNVSEQELLKMKNAAPNSVKIGGKWVSLDYFGPFGIALSGIMSVKKYGNDKNMAEKIWTYSKGVVSKASQIPGSEIISDGYKFLVDLDNSISKKEGSDKLNPKTMTDSLLNFVASRSIPSFVSDIANGTDRYQRDTKGMGFSSKIQSKIPFARESLPEKKTVVGDKMTNENFLSTILFGSRVKTVKEDNITKEMNRLKNEGMLPSLTNITKNDKVEDLKTQIPVDKFNEFQSSFANDYKDKVSNLIQSPFYKNASIDKKKDLLNNQKETSLKIMLSRYGYKAKTPVAETRK